MLIVIVTGSTEPACKERKRSISSLLVQKKCFKAKTFPIGRNNAIEKLSMSKNRTDSLRKRFYLLENNTLQRLHRQGDLSGHNSFLPPLIRERSYIFIKLEKSTRKDAKTAPHKILSQPNNKLSTKSITSKEEEGKTSSSKQKASYATYPATALRSFQSHQKVSYFSPSTLTKR